MTDLAKAVRRAVLIRRRDYVVTLDAEGVTFREKGRRTNVVSIPWLAVLESAELLLIKESLRGKSS